MLSRGVIFYFKFSAAVALWVARGNHNVKLKIQWSSGRVRPLAPIVTRVVTTSHHYSLLWSNIFLFPTRRRWRWDVDEKARRRGRPHFFMNFNLNSPFLRQLVLLKEWTFKKRSPLLLFYSYSTAQQHLLTLFHHHLHYSSLPLKHCEYLIFLHRNSNLNNLTLERIQSEEGNFESFWWSSTSSFVSFPVAFVRFLLQRGP